MMFMLHTAIGVLLIALALGIFLFAWSDKNGSDAGKFFGVIIPIVAVLGILCTSYYGIKYWYDGYFTMPMPMVQMMESMKNSGMMDNRSMMGNMMDGAMMNNENMQQHEKHKK